MAVNIASLYYQFQCWIVLHHVFYSLRCQVMKHSNHFFSVLCPLDVGFKHTVCSMRMMICISQLLTTMSGCWVVGRMSHGTVDNPTILVWSGRSTMIPHPTLKLSNVWYIPYNTLVWRHVYFPCSVSQAYLSNYVMCEFIIHSFLGFVYSTVEK